MLRPFNFCVIDEVSTACTARTAGGCGAGLQMPDEPLWGCFAFDRAGTNLALQVDSILIDEARTPLIISGTADKPSDKYYKVRHWLLIRRLTATRGVGWLPTDAGRQAGWNEPA